MTRIFSRAPRVLYDTLDERAVLIDAQGTELITLNALGTRVWQALDGARDDEAITGEITARFADVDPRRITDDVHGFLDELLQLGLITEVTDLAAHPHRSA